MHHFNKEHGIDRPMEGRTAALRNARPSLCDIYGRYAADIHTYYY